MKTTTQLVEGTAGNGSTIYLVVTVNASDDWKHVERFQNKAEAVNWIRWA